MRDAYEHTASTAWFVCSLFIIILAITSAIGYHNPAPNPPKKAPSSARRTACVETPTAADAART